MTTAAIPKLRKILIGLIIVVTPFSSLTG